LYDTGTNDEKLKAKKGTAQDLDLTLPVGNKVERKEANIDLGKQSGRRGGVPDARETQLNDDIS
jgi:hypothetical protein